MVPDYSGFWRNDARNGGLMFGEAVFGSDARRDLVMAPDDWANIRLMRTGWDGQAQRWRDPRTGRFLTADAAWQRGLGVYIWAAPLTDAAQLRASA